MTKSYGGAQKRLRNTIIKQTHGYLGPHLPKLQPGGQTQSMLFRIDDTGPFWMTQAEREQKRHDSVLEGQTITRQYTMDELLKQLRQRGMLAKGKKQAIQSKAQEQNLTIEATKAKVIEG